MTAPTIEDLRRVHDDLIRHDIGSVAYMRRRSPFVAAYPWIMGCSAGFLRRIKKFPPIEGGQG